jgi:hypothetical protein
MRDPTVEPVPPHPDSQRQDAEPEPSSRWPLILGAGLAVVLTVNLALLVALAFGTPENRGPAIGDVIERWNAEIGDPDLVLSDTSHLCSREGASLADQVRITAACNSGVVNRIDVDVARSAGRSQEILDVLEAVFGDASRFDTATTGLTFDITIGKPRLVDPDRPESEDGIPLASASSDSIYERPGLMYGTTMVLILGVHVIAYFLRSRYWALLLGLSLAAWAAVLLADVRFLTSGRVLAALTAVGVASLVSNLLVLADQAPPPGPSDLTVIDIRPRPPEIDLTLEPPPLSPRWGNRKPDPDDRDKRPPRIL